MREVLKPAVSLSPLPNMCGLWLSPAILQWFAPDTLREIFQRWFSMSEQFLRQGRPQHLWFCSCQEFIHKNAGMVLPSWGFMGTGWGTANFCDIIVLWALAASFRILNCSLEKNKISEFGWKVGCQWFATSTLLRWGSLLKRIQLYKSGEHF